MYNSGPDGSIVFMGVAIFKDNVGEMVRTHGYETECVTKSIYVFQSETEPVETALMLDVLEGLWHALCFHGTAPLLCQLQQKP